ncbi:MAG: hypothetical protein V2A64_05445 [Candidatus Omnitrophota bacterium]
MENPLKKIPLDNKTIGLLILVVIIVVYVDWSFVLQPQFQKTGALNVKIKNMRTNLERLRKDLADMDDLKRKAVSVSGGSSFKAKELISAQNLPLLFKEIADIANKNQVKLMQIKPAWESKDTKPANTSKDAKSSNNLSKDQGLIMGLISLDMSCDYHHLGGFINDLENYKTFLAVEEIKITAIANNFLKQDVKLILKTNVKK